MPARAAPRFACQERPALMTSTPAQSQGCRPARHGVTLASRARQRLARMTAGGPGWPALMLSVLAVHHRLLAAASIAQVISNVTAWVAGILAGVATLFLTVGGLRYLMAGGDPAEVERAKTALKSAAIGYGLAALAPVIVTVLKSLVGR